MTCLFRKLIWNASVLFVLLMATTLSPNAFGQNKNSAPAGGNAPASGTAPAPTGGVTTVNQSSNILEYGMVVVMFGAALFAVCRSSRRN